MKAEKQLLFDEVQEKFGRSVGWILTRYEGISAPILDHFRAEMASTEGEWEVVKKRILVHLMRQEGIQCEQPGGHIGIVFAYEDFLTTLKSVYRFQKECGENFEVVSGFFEGAIRLAPEMKKISQLPNREGMQAELLSLLEAPLSQTLSTMEALLFSLPCCLENVSLKRGKE